MGGRCFFRSILLRVEQPPNVSLKKVLVFGGGLWYSQSAVVHLYDLSLVTAERLATARASGVPFSIL